MKLGKISWIILTIGIIIVAFGSLGVARSQQLEKQDRLNEELAVARGRLESLQLDQLSSQQEQLQKRLDETVAYLDTARDTLSQPLGSIGANDTLFDIAEPCGVLINTTSSPGLTHGNLAGVACFSVPLTATAKGDLLSLFDFIVKLNTDFTTGAVQSVDMSTSGNAPAVGGTASENITSENATPESTADSENATTDGWSANIRLAIYGLERE